MSESFKLGRLLDDNQCVEHSHARLYHKENYDGDVTFIVAGLPSGDATIVKNLARSLNEDCFLLYVHHTPRTDHNEGRYQSPLLNTDEVVAFLDRFGRFLATDGRHNFWIHAPNLSTTLVWENHNLLYCYGSIPQFEKDLVAHGYEWGDPSIPVPHTHFYHAHLDGELTVLMQSLSWTVSPLMPQDEQ